MCVSVAAVTLLLGALTWRWILAPSSTAVDDVAEADAIVLFVGGRGERLEAAEGLLASGAADVLVIPNGRAPSWPEAAAWCGSSGDVEVLCPEPDPDTTRGEARLIAELAEQRGWTSLIAVTSTYQLSRAALLLERCFDGTVTRIDASPEAGVGTWVRYVAHEWVGHLHARVVARGC
ncbi:MAG: YdcF family protein [Actinomycetota bacterium]